MSFILSDRLRFCIVGSSVILLDLAAGRYLTLASQHVATFQRWALGNPLSGTDLEVLRKLARQGLLVESDSSAAMGTSSVANLAAPAALFELEEQNAGLALVIAALGHRMLWAWRVRFWSIRSLVRRIESYPRPGRADLSSVDLSRMKRLVRSFDIADRILGSHNLCLARSLALAAACRARRLPATLVIAVRPAPFVAHCWVQHGGLLLNEHPDRAQQYTPILMA